MLKTRSFSQSLRPLLHVGSIVTPTGPFPCFSLSSFRCSHSAAAEKELDDPYVILGVPRNSNKATIRQAYLKMVLENHPDAVGQESEKVDIGDEKVLKEFLKVAKAYEVLMDDDKRALFDFMGPSAFQDTAHSVEPEGEASDELGMFETVLDQGFMDLFGDDMFGHIGMVDRVRGVGGSGCFQSDWVPQDIVVDPRCRNLKVELSDVQAAEGTEVQVTTNCIGLCSSCIGSRVDRGCKPVRCGRCRGTGQRLGDILLIAPCGYCGGLGKRFPRKCPMCDGFGVRREHRSYVLRIPKGTEDGTVMHLTGKGEHISPESEPGDLLVTVLVPSQRRSLSGGGSFSVPSLTPWWMLWRRFGRHPSSSSALVPLADEPVSSVSNNIVPFSRKTSSCSLL